MCVLRERGLVLGYRGVAEVCKVPATTAINWLKLQKVPVLGRAGSLHVIDLDQLTEWNKQRLAAAELRIWDRGRD